MFPAHTALHKCCVCDVRWQCTKGTCSDKCMCDTDVGSAGVTAYCSGECFYKYHYADDWFEVMHECCADM